MSENLRTSITLFTTISYWARSTRMPVGVHYSRTQCFYPVQTCFIQMFDWDISRALQSKENWENKNSKRELNRDPRQIGIQEKGYSLLKTIHKAQSGNIFARISSLSKCEDQRDVLEKVRGHSGAHAELCLESNLTVVQCKIIIFPHMELVMKTWPCVCKFVTAKVCHKHWLEGMDGKVISN